MKKWYEDCKVRNEKICRSRTVNKTMTYFVYSPRPDIILQKIGMGLDKQTA